MKQLHHDDFEPGSLDKSIILICSHLQSPVNLASLCRVAEAFGVIEFYIHQENKTFIEMPRFIKAARHTHKQIPIKIYTSLENIIENLKSQNYSVVGLEYCDNSTNLKNFKPQTKIAILIGHEKYGIDQSDLDKLDDVLHVEMYGKNSSMNVSHAAAIALYHCVNYC